MPINIGDLELAIRVNTEALEAVGPQLQKVVKSMDLTVKSVARLEKSISKSMGLAAGATTQLVDTVSKMETSTTRSAKKQAKSVEKGSAAQVIANAKTATAAKAAARVQIKAVEDVVKAENTAVQKRINASTGGAGANANIRNVVGLEDQSRESKLALGSVSRMEAALQKQRNTLAAVNRQRKDLNAQIRHSSSTQAEASKQIAAVNAAYRRYRQTLKSGALSTEAFATAQNKLKDKLASVKRGMRGTAAPTGKMAAHMQELTKSIQIALGPLSGVASRITAFSSLMTSANLGIAAFIGGTIAFAAVLAKSALAAGKYESQMLKLGAALRVTGMDSQYTVDQLDNMAVTLGRDTLTSATAARDAIASLLTFNNLLGDSLERTLGVAQNMAAAGFGDLNSNVQRLGRLLEDPITNLDTLRRAGVQFTTAQKKMIKQLIATGDRSKALGIIFKQLEKFEQQGTAEAEGMLGAFDTLGESMTRFFEVLGRSSILQAVTDTVNVLSTAITQNTNDMEGWTDTFSFVQAAANGVGASIRFLVDNFALIAQSLAVGAVTSMGISMIKLAASILKPARAAVALSAAFGGSALSLASFGTAARATMSFLMGWPALLATAVAALGIFIYDVVTAETELDKLEKNIDKSSSAVTSFYDAVKQGRNPSVYLSGLRKEIKDASRDVETAKNLLAEFKAAGKSTSSNAYLKLTEALSKALAKVSIKTMELLTAEEDLKRSRSARNVADLKKTYEDLAGAFDPTIVKTEEFRQKLIQVNTILKNKNSVYREYLKQFADDNGVLSRSAPKLDEFTQSLIRMKRAITHELGNAVIPADLLSGLDAMKKKLDAANAAVANIGLRGAGGVGSAVDKMFEDVQKEFDGMDTTEMRAAISIRFGVTGDNLEEIKKNVAEKLTKALETMGRVKSVSSLADQFKKMKAQVNESAQASTGMSASAIAMGAAFKNITDGDLQFLNSALVENYDNVEQAKAAFTALQAELLGAKGFESLADELDRMNESMATLRIQQQASSRGEIINPNMIGLLQRAQQLTKNLGENELTKLSSEFGLTADSVEDLNAQLVEMWTKEEEWKVFAANAEKAMGDIRSAFSNEILSAMSGDFDNLGNAFKSMIDQMVADALAADLASALFRNDKGSGTFDFLTGLMPGGAAPISGATLPGIGIPDMEASLMGRAAGGSVTGGTPFLVGEEGPEVFVPGRNGTIIPNDVLGSSQGGSAPIINLTINVASGASVERQTISQIQAGVAASMNRSLRRNA